MQQCIKIYYSIFIQSSTCFGGHAVHRQELKTALVASGFAYLRGCWTLRLLDADSVQQPQRPTTSHVCKTRGYQCSFELLTMGGVSPETCWASYKYGIINFDTLLHLVGFFCMRNTPLFTQVKVLQFQTYTTFLKKSNNKKELTFFKHMQWGTAGGVKVLAHLALINP